MTQEEAKKQIEKLVKKYESLTPAQKKKYNESMTCKDFILPLFLALGWDVYNDDSLNEVTSETQVSGKRADYAFHVHDVIKFFIEAKKISVDLREEKLAEQAVFYAWHKSVPWAILTDFESIKVFNAEWDEPDVEQSLLFEIPYTDYLTDKRLWWLSKKSMLKGELDKYAEENFKKPKREPVDRQLANDLVRWRTSLFSELKQWNSKKLLTDGQIAKGIQQLLDRFIFIRTTEDRKIEGEKLRELARNWEEAKGKINLEEELKKLFEYYNKEYDSKLFEPSICDALTYEDKLLSLVIKQLYKNKSGIRYNFSLINADVLGSIYEQYLGQIQQNETDKKISKRKSQGIYYTPRYIVDFIVRNTLGEAVKDKSGHEALKVTVLDPACGSGSFLIKAFEILDRHIQRENNQINAQKFTNYARKVQILTSNIYGVDLDEEAVEIAQLNLLLKVLEHRERLPNLVHNIECGNSLISGTEKVLQEKFGKDWKKKKPFNWKERFKRVFDKKGFDIIIGNPPYIKEFVDKSAFDGLHDNPYYQGKMDIWTMFACISIDILKDGGYFSFIAPNNWVTNAGASIFRDKILKEGEIINYIDFGDYKVFQDAGIQTMIFVFKKCKPRKKYKINYTKITNKNLPESELIKFLQSNGKVEIDGIDHFDINFEAQKYIGKNVTFSSFQNDEILNKIESFRNFELTNKEVGQGIVSPQEYVIDNHLKVLHGKQIHKGDGIFVLSDNEVKNFEFNKQEKEVIRPFYTSKEIDRFFSNPNNKKWIIYSDVNVRKNINLYPNIKNHLDKFKDVITSSFAPYGLHRARDQKFFEGEKIFSIRKTDTPRFSYNNFSCYVSQTFFIIKTDRVDLRYLTGLLNSKLVYFWLKNKGKLQGDLLQIDKEPLLQIPINIPKSKAKQEEIIKLVEKIIKLNQEFQKLDPILDKEEIEEKGRKIQEIDKQIDQEVYKLYGLTSEEIKIVEK